MSIPSFEEVTKKLAGMRQLAIDYASSFAYNWSAVGEERQANKELIAFWTSRPTKNQSACLVCCCVGLSLRIDTQPNIVCGPLAIARFRFTEGKLQNKTNMQ
jgi:hypothetical protein